MKKQDIARKMKNAVNHKGQYRNRHGVVVNEQGWDIGVKEFEIQPCNYVHFRTNTFGRSIFSPISFVMG